MQNRAGAIAYSEVKIPWGAGLRADLDAHSIRRQNHMELDQ